MQDTVMGSAEGTRTQAGGSVPWPWRYYMLAVLTCVSAISIMDRQIITILIQPIKRDLSLTDTHIGMLTGIAFALVYATLCIPAARLGDSWHRSKVVAIAIGFWSIMTMLCGVAQNFVQLFLARLGVGAGEACGNPSSHALLSDIFPRKVRATAASFFMLSVPLGTSLGLWLGGWASSQFDWRVAFLIAGIPGLILVPLLLFTFPKIPKGMADGVLADQKPAPFVATIRQLWSISALPNMLIGAALQSFVAFGLLTWIPAFIERSHHISGAALGASLGAAFGTGSLIGHLSGGPLTDFLGRRDLRMHFWLPTICVLIAASCAAGAFVAPVEYVFLLLGLQMMFSGLFAAPMMAITATLAPVTSRATAAACIVFAMNLIGLGLGPVAVGVASDLLRPSFGEESLRIALLGATLVAIPASFFFFRSSRTYRADIAAAEERARAAMMDVATS